MRKSRSIPVVLVILCNLVITAWIVKANTLAVVSSTAMIASPVGPNKLLGRATQEAGTNKEIEFSAEGVDTVTIGAGTSLPSGLFVYANGKKITIRGDSSGKSLGEQPLAVIHFIGKINPMNDWKGPPIIVETKVDFIWHIHPGGDSDFIPTLGDTVMSQNP